MTTRGTRALGFVLLGIHALLGLWGVVGFIELIAPTTPWPPISNEAFPRDILLMQWTLVLVAAVVFIVGYTARWRHTPVAMACVYTAMAALCAVETFAFMTSDLRFVAMAAEYVAYAAILVFLFRWSRFQATPPTVPA